jgi:hypothetical protein
MLFYEKGKDHNVYEDEVVYARKGSVLLKKTLLEMS